MRLCWFCLTILQSLILYINHNFFQRLVSRFGITGSALDRFSSYFKDRSQSIFIYSSVSNPHTPLEGVPQGSVIGPLSSTMYTSPLEDIIASHSFGRMIYADDTQVYVTLKKLLMSVQFWFPNLNNVYRTSKHGRQLMIWSWTEIKQRFFTSHRSLEILLLYYLLILPMFLFSLLHLLKT